MRPSSLGGGRILRRTLSVRLSVRPSVPLLFLFTFYSRTVLIQANIQNRKTSVFAYGPASRMYFSARTEGRISYGHLGRTNLFLLFYWFINTEIQKWAVSWNADQSRRQLVDRIYSNVASRISLHCLLDKLSLVHGANCKLTDRLTFRPVNKVSWTDCSKSCLNSW